jgi:hypothetical protein
MSGFFGTALDYHELNAGAHRKPPKNLIAPALVRHLTFWTHADPRESITPQGTTTSPTSDTSQQSKASTETPDQIKRNLDSFILALCGAINEKGCTVDFIPCISKICLLFDNACREKSFEPVSISSLTPRQDDIFKSTRRAVSLKFKWKDLDVAIRFEIHTEYFSMSTFIELDKRRRGPPYSKLSDLNLNIEIMRDYLKTDDKALAKKANKYFFRQFWRDFEEEILSHPSLIPFKDIGPFKRVFADFRGFIVSEQAVAFPYDEASFEPDKSPRWGKEAKKKFLPLVQDQDAAQRRYESAINYVLDGRAFYMSTLAPQLPSAPAAERIALEFIVYVNQLSPDGKTIVNKWQLGRLVNHLLLLGTLRLCALKDVKLLHESGRRLGLLDQRTQAARNAINVSKGDPTNTAPPALDSKTTVREPQPARFMNRIFRLLKTREPVTEEKNQTTPLKEKEAPDDNQALARNNKVVMGLIRDAHQELNSITGDFLDATGSGLLYRIERSRYYVQQFDDNVKLLRIKRLEGDQPYGQFIKQRLGSEFDFIDRLGRRYERATGNMVTLDQNYLAITQNALVEKATRIDEETYSIQSGIRTIQEWGEFALLAALVPYYVMHLLVLILGDENPFVPPIAVFFWSLFGILAVFRKFKGSKYSVAFRMTIAILIVIGVMGPIIQLRSLSRDQGHDDRKNTPASRPGTPTAGPVIPAPEPQPAPTAVPSPAPAR